MNPRNQTYPKVIQLYVTEEQYKKLRIHALTEDKTMSEIMRGQIDGLPEYTTKRRVIRRKK